MRVVAVGIIVGLLGAGLVGAVEPHPTDAVERSLPQDGAWTLVAEAPGLVERPRVGPLRLADALTASAATPAAFIAQATEVFRAASGLDQHTAGTTLHTAKGASDGFPGHASVDMQGDADGDGRSEVLVVHFPVDEEPTDDAVHTLRMLASPDGGTLWTWDIPAILLGWAGGVDMDGDGLTDVVALALTADGEPVEQGDLVSQAFTWRLVVVRGHDGHVLWERSESWSFVYAPRGPLAGTVFSPALFYFAVIGADADGDGGRDLWINAIDGGFVRAPDGSFPGGGTGRATVASGATGGALSVFGGAFASGGGALAFPSFDLDGDLLADTVTSRIPMRMHAAGVNAASGAVSAWTGIGGVPLWSRVFPTSFALGIPLPDLDGDGRGDVATTLVDPFGVVSLTALDGAAGATLWTIVRPLFLGFAVGDLDGVAGSDLLFLDANTFGGALSPRVQGVAGRTGAVLYDVHPFSVPIPTNGYAAVEYRPLSGDFDGDGAQDTILNARNGRFPLQFVGDIHLIRSVDGSEHLVVPGTEYTGRPAGDLTGDGFDDMLRLVIETSPFAVQVAAVDTRDGAVGWDTRIDDVRGLQLEMGGDVGGSNADDLVVMTVRGDLGGPEDTGPGAHVAAWDGPSGGTLWAVP